jgi:hypothetical protein
MTISMNAATEQQKKTKELKRRQTNEIHGKILRHKL